jgi:hypothetical protein
MRDTVSKTVANKKYSIGQKNSIKNALQCYKTHSCNTNRNSLKRAKISNYKSNCGKNTVQDPNKAVTLRDSYSNPQKKSIRNGSLWKRPPKHKRNCKKLLTNYKHGTMMFNRLVT